MVILFVDLLLTDVYLMLKPGWKYLAFGITAFIMSLAKTDPVSTFCSCNCQFLGLAGAFEEGEGGVGGLFGDSGNSTFTLEILESHLLTTSERESFKYCLNTCLDLNSTLRFIGCIVWLVLLVFCSKSVKVSERSEASLGEDEHTRDESCEIVTDGNIPLLC